MRSIHFDDLHVPHVPRSSNLFFVSIGALGIFAFALLTFVVAWFGGGRELATQLGGQVTLAVLVIGVVVSAVFSVITNPKEWGPPS
jgi:ABC-type Na+ efflux pump permease subunit